MLSLHVGGKRSVRWFGPLGAMDLTPRVVRASRGLWWTLEGSYGLCYSLRAM